MTLFNIPRKLADLEKDRGQELSAAEVPPNLNPSNVEAALEESVSFLASGQLSIVKQECFDATYVAVRGLELSEVEISEVLPVVKSMCQNLTELVTSGLEELQEGGLEKSDPVVVMHRSAVHAYVFFLYCIHERCHSRILEASKAEELEKGPKRGRKGKAAKNDEEGWPPAEARILKALQRTLSADLDATLYRSPADKFRLVEVCVITAARCLQGSPGPAEKMCLDILALASTKHAQGTGSLDVVAEMLFQLVKGQEAGPKVATNAASLVFITYQSPALVKALLGKFCEVGPDQYDEMEKRDNKCITRVADMVLLLAEAAPAVVHTAMSQLIPYFACQCAHMIRSRLVSSMKPLMQWYISRELTEKGSRQLQVSRQHVVDTLIQRANDVAAHVRKEALDTIKDLIDSNLWPIEYFVTTAKVAVARLEDGPSVATAALKLLVWLVGETKLDLNDAYLLATINRYEEQLKGMQPDVCEEDQDVGPQWEAGPLNINPEPQGQEAAAGPKSADGAVVAGSQPDIIMPTQADEGLGAPGGNLTYSQLRLLVAMMKVLLEVSRTLSAALPEVEIVLTSESPDLATTAVKFLTLCSKKQLQGVDGSWRRVWHLALCGSEKVRETVCGAVFKFLEPDTVSSHHDKTRHMAHKLVEMIDGIALCDQVALDELVRIAAPSNQLSKELVNKLLGDLHTAVGKAALLAKAQELEALEARDLACRFSMLSVMLARHVPQLALSYVPKLVTNLKWSHLVIKDAVLVRDHALMLAELAPSLHAAERRTTSGYGPASYIPQALSNLLSVLVSSHLPDGPGSWTAAAQAAIKAIYMLHAEPQKLMEPLMRHLTLEAVGGRFPAAQLTRTVFIVGCVATQQLALVDSLAKRIRRERNDAAKGSAKVSADDMEAQLGTGQAAEHMLDALQEDLEAKIMSGKALVGMWGPVISGLCLDPSLLGLHADLASAAMTTLTKLMALDADYCEENCRVFFTRLTFAGSAVRLSPQVRCNMLVALGDLGRRHPNVIEPWTERMFVCLHDDDEEVAKTCLRILAHLILSDMTKPKGHMAQVARCLVARSPAMRDLALRLFNSLSKKQAKGGANKVYQYLPEIISCVTRGNPMPEQDFKTMMHRLLGYVKADKLADQLKGRLCERFENIVCEFSTSGGTSVDAGAAAGGGTADAGAAVAGATPGLGAVAAATFDDVVREWHSIADCMALLQFTEKGLEACMEKLRCYKHALGDEHVYRVFKAMAEHGRRRNRTAESKKEAEEWGARLDELHNQYREEQLQRAAAAARAAEAAQATATAAGAGQAAMAQPADGPEAGTDQQEGEQSPGADGDDIDMDHGGAGGGGENEEDGEGLEKDDDASAESAPAAGDNIKDRANHAEQQEQAAGEADSKDRESDHDDETEAGEGGDEEKDEGASDERPSPSRQIGSGADDDDDEYGDEDDEGDDDEGPVDMDMDDACQEEMQATPIGHRRCGRHAHADSASNAASPLGRPVGTPMVITPLPQRAGAPEQGPAGDDMAWSPAPSTAAVRSLHQLPLQENTNPAVKFEGFRVKPGPKPAFAGFRIKPDPEALGPQQAALGPILQHGVVGIRIKPDPEGPGRR